MTAPRRLRLSTAALKLLEAQPYPGNVRELRNLLERTALLCDSDQIEVEHVQEAIATGRRPTRTPRPADAASAPTDLRSIEREALRSLVTAHTGSRAELAADSRRWTWGDRSDSRMTKNRDSKIAISLIAKPNETTGSPLTKVKFSKG